MNIPRLLLLLLLYRRQHVGLHESIQGVYLFLFLGRCGCRRRLLLLHRRQHIGLHEGV